MESSFKERLVWSALSAGAVALAGYLAQRLVEGLWRRRTGREPPHELPLLSPAFKRAGRGAAARVADRLSPA